MTEAFRKCGAVFQFAIQRETMNELMVFGDTITDVCSNNVTIRYGKRESIPTADIEIKCDASHDTHGKIVGICVLSALRELGFTKIEPVDRKCVVQKK